MDRANDLAEAERVSLLLRLLARWAATADAPLLAADGTRLCRDCFEPIALARLAVLPTATTCIHCANHRQGTPWER